MKSKFDGATISSPNVVVMRTYRVSANEYLQQSIPDWEAIQANPRARLANAVGSQTELECKEHTRLFISEDVKNRDVTIAERLSKPRRYQ